MLTLLEPPGAKRVQQQSNRSEQHLLTLGGAPDEDEYYENNDFDAVDYSEPSNSAIVNFLDKHLVGKSSSDENTTRWRKEFCERPSWCDADLVLQQIKRKKARGNKWALYSRSLIQKILFALGNFVHRNAAGVILSVVLLFSICCYGLQYVHIETDIVKLWVAKGGRLDEELNFLSNIQSKFNKTNGDDVEIVRENGLGGGYQVVIQTPEYEGQNVLAKGPLLKHVDIMKEIANYSVNVLGEEWSLSDICFKPAAPAIDESSLASGMENTIDKLVPCIWITPIDCFWEGAKALGPNPPVPISELHFALRLLKSLPEGNFIKWINFDPWEVFSEINKSFNLGAHFTFFERSGIGHGYLDRPCMNPLDEDCPSLSPNYFDACPLIDRFRQYAALKNISIVADPIKEPEGVNIDFLFNFFQSKQKRSVDPIGPIEVNVPILSTVNASIPSLSTETDEKAAEEAAKAVAEKVKYCNQWRGPMMRWMDANRDKWEEFLQMSEFPRDPDFASRMTGGCPGFASGVLHWPEDMILGGATRPARGAVLDHAAALQSVFLVASPNDVFLRFKDRTNRNSSKLHLNQSDWNAEAAQRVIQTWQRNFTRSLYNHRDNFDSEGTERRTIHPLASTSIADMLEEFCQFNYTIILVGYGLMLIYAIMTQMKRERCLPSSQSCMGLALAGVLVVTFASVAGLGLATWFGIEFNAATTQIVPFLTLGIGVDNMFMLLHNYHDSVLMNRHFGIGILMRETGMSILCTSINNILSFLTGTLLPIPALRSFCAQSSILLSFNFIAILTLYPAIISIDWRRRKAGRRDVLCCLYGDTREEAYSMIVKPKVQQKRTIGETASCNNLMFKEIEEEEETQSFSLHYVIKNYYIPLISKKSVKTFVLVSSAGLLLLALIGMQRASIGLELSDVLPEHTAPAKFLQARDKYFSFYPMFIVLKGDIDYPAEQHRIDQLRQSIGASQFVIKNSNDEPSEKYWLSMMRDWLKSIQSKYEEAIDRGYIDKITGDIVNDTLTKKEPSGLTEDARIGRSLVCSYGMNYQCKGRVGKVKIVDEVNMINQEGFYNYLTAWYNQDNMMYYVSQASFFPSPPKFQINHTTTLVPPAEPLQYSQIPFYLTKLIDTPVIIQMIEEIRQVCDEYTSMGVANYPSGIAFTFWEQYLHLTGNLLQAIMIIAFAVFCVISLLLFNPWAAATVLIILVAMTVELAGFMGWAGVKLNPVSAVTLITAVGIGVEFTAHVVLAYLTSMGSRCDRTSYAVDRVFVPVIHGALSTLLGILMLGFSEFEFVVKYFFVVMSALIVIGVLNGLILLPVLLSLIGPPQEVISVDGKSRLSLPPPLRRVPRDVETDEDDDTNGGLIMRYSRNI